MYVPGVSRALLKDRPREDESKSLAPPAGVNMIELLTRQKELRTVSPSALPVHLGGRHESYKTEESPLKKELLLKANQIQDQLRPKEEFKRQREEHENRELNKEFKALFNNHGPFTKESPMRPKYELDKIVKSRPGWLKVQAEIRKCGRTCLNQVVFDEFYVVRSSDLPV